GAFLGEVHRHGAADPAVAAGDRRDLALELAGRSVSLALVLRGRLHLALAAGLARLLLRRHAAAAPLGRGRLAARGPAGARLALLASGGLASALRARLHRHGPLRSRPTLGTGPVGTMTLRWERHMLARGE